MLLSGDSCGEIMFERDMGIVYHMHGTPPFLYPVPSPAVIALDRPFLGKIKRTGRQIESLLNLETRCWRYNSPLHPNPTDATFGSIVLRRWPWIYPVFLVILRLGSHMS